MTIFYFSVTNVGAGTHEIKPTEGNLNRDLWNIDVLDEIRQAYNDFLPSFHYCFAYWIKYSELKIKHGNYERGFEILHTALIDLWIAYLEVYHKMYSKHLENFDEVFREHCESSVLKVGLEFRSDDIWERYIEWEHERNDLKFITEIYNQLIGVPAKLYNKHWDIFAGFEDKNL